MSVPQSGVVVGVDGSPGSRTALAYAAGEAQLRGLPLTVLHTWEPVPLYEGAVLMSMDDVQEAEAAVLQSAEDLLEELAPGLDHSTQLVKARAESALIDASESAALVVLGCHAGSSAWLGPVLGHLAMRARCPMVAVPADAPLHHGGVVVGVDGSEVSTEAVAFAFDQASRWGCPLTAVLAVKPGFDAYMPSQELLDQIHERGRRYLAEALAGYQEKYPDVEVAQLVSLEGPLPALRQAAQDAGLVVVGSHGRGAVLRVALGSVSSSLLRAAPCPVAVIRPREAAPEAHGTERHGAERHGEEVPAGPGAAPFAGTL